MNKDQVKGRVKEAEGKIKETAGKIAGDKRLEEKGKIEKTVGQVQKEYGDKKHDMHKHH
ncbi:MAG: CsbD-like protein [Collimonas fungivorans]|uniref:CsbD family protein n=1 Tax=Collimonas fungivorans TaxID=158899 RepID=UPI0026F089E6|nr:CsbD family protein [Collimonas fungivorans]MDB5765331.1 CsbD-like protein [Collimonas fungivorans]